MNTLYKSTALDPVWKQPLPACPSDNSLAKNSFTLPDALAYISDQEGVIQAQSKLIQQLTTKLALHEAFEEGK